MIANSTLLRFRPRLSLIKLARSFYDTRTKNDTIFSTITASNPSRGSPLGVIRISGCRTFEVMKQIALRRSEDSVSRNKKDIKTKINPRQATLAKIVDPTSKELIDIALLIWFPGPRSYTGEDSCELHLHGSSAIISSVLDILGKFPGLRPAEPGEFTKRAYKNGKMSLIQAESLPDLIDSKTNYQRRLALKGLDDSVRQLYEVWIEKLVQLLAHLEASIDFGEDELLGEKQVVCRCIDSIRDIAKELDKFIEESSTRRDIIQSGVRIVILGKPNSGKSTLMNLLCRQNKSIVSDLSGTTRDIVEHHLQFGGHAVTLLDTAGLRDINSKESDSVNDNSLAKHAKVEEEGIKRAYEAASKADVIIYLADGASLRSDNDLKEFVMDFKDKMEKHRLTNVDKMLRLVINKMDLNQEEQNIAIETKLQNLLASMSWTSLSPMLVSCSTQANMDAFVTSLTDDLNKLTKLQSHSFGPEGNWTSPLRYEDLSYVNQRHLSLLKSCSRHLNQASKLSLKTIDEMAQHVRESVDYLSRIVGTVSSEDVIDVIFRDFCIGK